MKNSALAYATVAILCISSTANAQRNQGPQRGGPGDGPPPPGMNQGNINSNRGQPMRNQAVMNQNGNMPSVRQLAQMMVANFDADASGELGFAELERALMAVQQMMQNQGNRQNQIGGQQNARANQQNAFGGVRNQQDATARANRPPPGRQGNAGGRR